MVQGLRRVAGDATVRMHQLELEVQAGGHEPMASGRRIDDEAQMMQKPRQMDGGSMTSLGSRASRENMTWILQMILWNHSIQKGLRIESVTYNSEAG
jgi:hypothetical protein